MSEDLKPLVVGLAGFGTVGGGLCGLLADNADIIRRRSGRAIVIKKILVRDPAKKRSVAPPEGAVLTTRMEDLLDDDSVDVIVELVGGLDVAKKIILGALERGKDVVTANKALLAEDGADIFRQAFAAGKNLRYEASIAGAIPVVQALKESLNGNRISSLMGILNGTSNYILSEMTTNGLDFDTALRQAQELGFAEADPGLDIGGWDAAHKLALLIRLSYGLDYPFANLHVSGIGGMAAMDIRLAREFGYRIKLIGHAVDLNAQAGGQSLLAAGVFPALVRHTLLLARAGGSYNGLRVYGNASGPLFFHGRGAGSLPTAGAVLSDLLAVARMEKPDNTGFVDPVLPAAEVLPFEDWRSCFYVRVMVADAPGMLRDISGCMAAEGISVAQMVQKAGSEAGVVPLVFMTHETSARSMDHALGRAEKAGLLREKAVYFRVIDTETGVYA